MIIQRWKFKKDASSTAIYGTRGPTGYFLKPPKEVAQESVIDADFFFTWSFQMLPQSWI